MTSDGPMTPADVIFRGWLVDNDPATRSLSVFLAPVYTPEGMPCRVEADPTGNVPFWECPCRECWSLECQSIRDTNDASHPDDRCHVPTYAEWLREFAPGAGLDHLRPPTMAPTS